MKGVGDIRVIAVGAGEKVVPVWEPGCSRQARRSSSRGVSAGSGKPSSPPARFSSRCRRAECRWPQISAHGVPYACSGEQKRSESYMKRHEEASTVSGGPRRRTAMTCVAGRVPSGGCHRLLVEPIRSI